MSEIVTPESFLKNIGIDLKKTALLSVIGEHMKQPDLCYLLDGYAKAKFQSIAKRANEDDLTPEDVEWLEDSAKIPEALKMFRQEKKEDVSPNLPTGPD